MRIVNTTLLCVLIWLPGASRAGDAEGGVVEVWASPTSTYVMFSIDDGDAQPHRCNTSGRYAIDTRAPGGRATLEVLLLAKDTDQALFVKSLNTCNEFDAENVRYIILR